MKVWIDQDLCTGDGLCEEIAPDVFTLLDDGLAYVKEGDKVFSDPGGAEGLAVVPAEVVGHRRVARPQEHVVARWVGDLHVARRAEAVPAEGVVLPAIDGLPTGPGPRPPACACSEDR